MVGSSSSRVGSLSWGLEAFQLTFLERDITDLIKKGETWVEKKKPSACLLCKGPSRIFDAEENTIPMPMPIPYP